MNKFTITIELETYSDSPEDWITESIIDQLEDDESLVSLTVENGHTVEEPIIESILGRLELMSLIKQQLESLSRTITGRYNLYHGISFSVENVDEVIELLCSSVVLNLGITNESFFINCIHRS